jgi:hypothetical protein
LLEGSEFNSLWRTPFMNLAGCHHEEKRKQLGAFLLVIKKYFIGQKAIFIVLDWFAL